MIRRCGNGTAGRVGLDDHHEGARNRELSVAGGHIDNGHAPVVGCWDPRDSAKSRVQYGLLREASHGNLQLIVVRVHGDDVLAYRLTRADHVFEQRLDDRCVVWFFRVCRQFIRVFAESQRHTVPKYLAARVVHPLSRLVVDLTAETVVGVQVTQVLTDGGLGRGK